MRTAALQYSELDYPVFPLIHNSKSPLGGTNGCKDATMDFDIIDNWFSDGTYNLGLSTNGLLIIDIDIKDGPNEWFIANAGRFDGVPYQRTPSGGYHFFYDADGKEYRNTASQIADQVDTRGNGGYIVASPSVLDGDQYNFPEPLPARNELPKVPAWLKIELSKTKDRDNSEILGNVIEWGRQNNTLTRWAGLLRHRGASEAEILAMLSKLNQDRCRPPMAQNEVDKIAESVAKYNPDTMRTDEIEGYIDEVKPDGVTDPGPFPKHLLNVPGFIGDVIKHNLDIAWRPQPVLALAGAISLQAVLAARKVKDEYGSRTNVYILGVAPASGGKDQAVALNRDILEQANLAHLEGGEDFASDSGILKAVELQGGIMFQIDEIGLMLQSVSQATSNHLSGIPKLLMTLYSKAGSTHTGKMYVDHTRNKKIKQPCLIIHGITVPKSFYDTLNEEAITNGFVPRLSIFEVSSVPKMQRKVSIDIPQSIIDTAEIWGAYTPGGNCSSITPQPATVTYTPDARAYLDKYSDDLDAITRDTTNPVKQCLYSRLIEKAQRFALIYACSQHGPVNCQIDLGAVKWAIGVQEYLSAKILHSANQYIAESEFDHLQKWAMRFYDRAGVETFTRREFSQKTRSIDHKKRKLLIDSLKEIGAITEEVECTGGRSTTIYRKN